MRYADGLSFPRWQIYLRMRGNCEDDYFSLSFSIIEENTVSCRGMLLGIRLEDLLSMRAK